MSKLGRALGVASRWVVSGGGGGAFKLNPSAIPTTATKATKLNKGRSIPTFYPATALSIISILDPLSLTVKLDLQYGRWRGLMPEPATTPTPVTTEPTSTTENTAVVTPVPASRNNLVYAVAAIVIIAIAALAYAYTQGTFSNITTPTTTTSNNATTSATPATNFASVQATNAQIDQDLNDINSASTDLDVVDTSGDEEPAL